MRKLVPVFCLVAATVLCAVGCVGPMKRAQQNAVVFHRLAPSDQSLVLRGKVRAGLDQAGVKIAWGEPDAVEAVSGSRDGKDRSDGKSGGARTEIWTYHQQTGIYGPLGSADQWQPGNSFVSPGQPRYLAAGYGIGGQGYEGVLLYHPRVRYVDSFLRRALFVDGKLERFETCYGQFAPLP